MDIMYYGDPYIEWQEEISSREEYEVSIMTVDELKTEVSKILVVEYDFLENVADSTVEEAVKEEPGMWNENADPKDLAAYLNALDENDFE
jgi:hypothetical protein